MPLGAETWTSTQQRPRIAFRLSVGGGCGATRFGAGLEAGFGLGLGAAGFGSGRAAVGAGGVRGEEGEPPYCQASMPRRAARATPASSGQLRSRTRDGVRTRCRLETSGGGGWLGEPGVVLVQVAVRIETEELGVGAQEPLRIRATRKQLEALLLKRAQIARTDACRPLDLLQTDPLAAARGAPVAQWIEQRFPRTACAGSIPAGGTPLEDVPSTPGRTRLRCGMTH